MSNMYVFISYAKEDLNKATLLYEALKRHGGVTPWGCDRAIPTEESWESVQMQGLARGSF